MRLAALLLYRLAWFVPTLLGLLAVTFVISRVIPSDPVALVAGETAAPAQVAALRHQLGFDRPLPVQFIDYVGRLARGDLGTSLYTTRPIVEDLAHRLPATIELTLVAMVVSVVVGIPLGVLSALWRNSLLDHALRVVTVSGLAIASFWLGIMLQLLFAMRLGWTPLNGRLPGFPPPGVTGLYLVDAALARDWVATRSHHLEVRLAVRAHLDGDADRSPLRHPARRGGGDGGRVRLAGDRHLRGEFDHPVRLQRGDGLHRVGGRHVHRREPARGCRPYARRSAGAHHMILRGGLRPTSSSEGASTAPSETSPSIDRAGKAGARTEVD